MAITDWPTEERPREKLLAFGAQALSTAELIALLFRTGVKGKTAVDLARETLSQFGSLRNLFSASQHGFCKNPGLGMAKYVQLQSAIELGRRHLQETLHKKDVITCPDDTRRYLLSCLRDYKHEVFACLFLDSKNQIISFDELFTGTIDNASIHLRVILQQALSYNAAGVIAAHNHPSGNPTPSEADKQITCKLSGALRDIDVRLLDHIIVGDGKTTSFAELGLMQ